MPSEHGAAHAAAVYLMEQYEEAQRHNSTPRSPTSPRGARGTSTRASRSRGSSPRYQTRSAASSISPRSTWAGRRDGGTLCRAPVPPRGLVSWTAGGVAMRSRPATAGPDPAFDLPVRLRHSMRCCRRRQRRWQRVVVAAGPASWKKPSVLNPDTPPAATTGCVRQVYGAGVRQ